MNLESLFSALLETLLINLKELSENKVFLGTKNVKKIIYRGRVVYPPETQETPLIEGVDYQKGNYFRTTSTSYSIPYIPKIVNSFTIRYNYPYLHTSGLFRTGQEQWVGVANDSNRGFGTLTDGRVLGQSGALWQQFFYASANTNYIVSYVRSENKVIINGTTYSYTIHVPWTSPQVYNLEVPSGQIIFEPQYWNNTRVYCVKTLKLIPAESSLDGNAIASGVYGILYKNKIMPIRFNYITMY